MKQKGGIWNAEWNLRNRSPANSSRKVACSPAHRPSDFARYGGYRAGGLRRRRNASTNAYFDSQGCRPFQAHLLANSNPRSSNARPNSHSCACA